MFVGQQLHWIKQQCNLVICLVGWAAKMHVTKNWLRWGITRVIGEEIFEWKHRYTSFITQVCLNSYKRPMDLVNLILIFSLPIKNISCPYFVPLSAYCRALIVAHARFISVNSSRQCSLFNFRRREENLHIFLFVSSHWEDFSVNIVYCIVRRKHPYQNLT